MPGQIRRISEQSAFASGTMSFAFPLPTVLCRKFRSFVPGLILCVLLVLQLLAFSFGPSLDSAFDLLVADEAWNPGKAKQHFSAPKPKSTNVAATQSSSHDSRRTIFLPPLNQTYHSLDFIRPSFTSIVKDHRESIIIGDLQFLLDFAIIGHAKAGTSTMMEWLRMHPQVLCRDQELPHLSLGRLGLFAKNLYNLDEHGDPSKLRAYKNPTDIQNLRAIRLLREYFPQTRLLIGIRHPIPWFQSFYNHRIQNTGDMPEPNRLDGICSPSSHGVCANRADFHLGLVRLGKTNYSNERDAFTHIQWKKLGEDSPPRTPNPVLIYDTNQLADTNATRSAQFRQDIQDFLGLTLPLSTIPHYSPGKKLGNATLQAERDALKMNICLDKHRELRKKLLEKAKRSAYYIQKYFLRAPDVFTSSPEFFREALTTYEIDPCKDGQFSF